jgi:hypothetical protein
VWIPSIPPRSSYLMANMYSRDHTRDMSWYLEVGLNPCPWGASASQPLTLQVSNGLTKNKSKQANGSSCHTCPTQSNGASSCPLGCHHLASPVLLASVPRSLFALSSSWTVPLTVGVFQPQPSAYTVLITHEFSYLQLHLSRSQGPAHTLISPSGWDFISHFA